MLCVLSESFNWFENLLYHKNKNLQFSTLICSFGQQFILIKKYSNTWNWVPLQIEQAKKEKLKQKRLANISHNCAYRRNIFRLIVVQVENNNELNNGIRKNMCL